MHADIFLNFDIMKNNPDGESIEVFAICYNEEFFLPYFIKHYQDMGAKITIFDNMSTDRSKEIILSSGCTYLTYESNNQIKDDIYLKIKNHCWKKSLADWVIVCDIDELIEVPFSMKKYTIINTRGFDMVGLPNERRGVPNRLYSKHIMFRPKYINEISYNPGCHTCSIQGKVIGSTEIANLLHYKYISEEYVFARHSMYQKRLSEINKSQGWGLEYQNVEREKIDQKFKDLRSSAWKISEGSEVINF